MPASAHGEPDAWSACAPQTPRCTPYDMVEVQWLWEVTHEVIQLMNVAETGEIVVVAKNGQPVAQLGPVLSRTTTLAGAHRGQITIHGDIVAPVDVPWEAECGSCSTPAR